MANKEHIEWFLKGVDSWNKRRQEEPFKPDFEGANISELPGTHVNSFEGVNLSNGFFHHTNFSGLNLKGADLRNSQLSGAILEGVDLSGAILIEADLYNAVLSKANLRGVKACKASFNSADLSGADLQDAELEGANLLAAKLIQANFTNTKPWKSLLYLFPEDQNQDRHLSIPPKEVKNVTDLVNICEELKNYYEDALTKNFFGDDWQFYYRGQCEKKWGLSPSVMRPSQDETYPFREKASRTWRTWAFSPSQNETYPFREKEGEMLLRLMSRRPEDFTGAPSALSQWVVAQHHGLKTRLLDITRNPLVALFHACENVSDEDQNDYYDVEGRLYVFAVPKLLIKPFDSDAISIVANLAKLPRYEQDLLLMGKELDIEEFYRRHYLLYEDIEDSCYRYIMGRLYHCIGQEKPYFKERIDIRDLLRVFVVEPQQSFERIRAQSGAFLVSAFHEQFERDKILDFNPCIPVYDFYDEITIPKESKEDILQELQLLNITREVLFPDFQEVAKAVVRQYEEVQNSDETSS